MYEPYTQYVMHITVRLAGNHRNPTSSQMRWTGKFTEVMAKSSMPFLFFSSYFSEIHLSDRVLRFFNCCSGQSARPRRIRRDHGVVLRDSDRRSLGKIQGVLEICHRLESCHSSLLESTCLLPTFNVYLEI
jgi:hypothetical protein